MGRFLSPLRGSWVSLCCFPGFRPAATRRTLPWAIFVARSGMLCRFADLGFLGYHRDST